MYKVWSDCIYYYSLSKRLQHTFVMSIQFQDDIDVIKLKKALEITRKRYPYFSIRREKTLKEIRLEHNDLEWILKEKSDSKTYIGGKESNYHLISFTYKKDWLYVNIFHGMCDADGALRLIRTLLYYYCKDKYDSSLLQGDALTIDDEILQEEIDDPYLNIPIKEIPKTKNKPIKQKYLKLNDINKYKIKDPYVYKLQIPQKELMNYCSDFDGSPATALSLFMARAIKELHQDVKETIGCGIATNLRPALGVKVSHQSTISMPILDFTDKTASKDLETQGTIFRGQVLLKCSKEALYEEACYTNWFFKFVNNLTLRFLKEMIMKKVIKMSMSNATCAVSYVGRCNFQDYEKYIKQVYTEPSVEGMSIMIEVNALNDVFCLSFIQEWKESTYFDAFLKKLDEYHISYKLINKGKEEIIYTKK